MTVMVLQIEGDDSTLQEGFQVLGAALKNLTQPPSVNVIGPQAATETFVGMENIETENDIVETPQTTNNSTSSKRKPPKTPEILDLPIEGQSVSLQDFLEPKPNGISKQYLLIAYWLKAQLKLDSISADHIHTCFRFLGWNTPKDAAQPLRDMKTKTQLFGKGENAGCYDINHIGENEVRDLRPELNELNWAE